ncbi:XK-related protein 7-like [Hetaerina americana]|uniref:XK-related protein 7-like n=1 Tax=Hetaerina americana TaxID=62018 RepID=UPI003A7F1C13
MSGDVMMLTKGDRCTEMSPCNTTEFDNVSNEEESPYGNRVNSEFDGPCEERQHSGNRSSNWIFDEPDYVPSSYKVTLWDITWVVFSIGSHVLDVAFDIYVAINFYLLAQTHFFIWTVIFIVVPSLSTTFISARWYVGDYKNNPEKKSPLKTWIIRCLALVLQLAPTLRYAESLNYAIKSRRYRKKNDKEKERYYCELMLKEDSDAALLRVVECFLESAPQLVLQLSILMYKNPKDYSFHEMLQWASTVMSLVSLAWALASYQRSLRYPQKNKNNISYKGMAFQFLWHLMVIVSRVTALSCLASKFPQWLILGCVIHIIFFTIYLHFKGPEGACGGSILWDGALCLLLAAIYIFTGIHTRDGDSRHFYSLLYSVYAMENIALVIVWFCFVASQVPKFLIWLIPVASIGLFILGLCFMIMYYLYFHPKKLTGNNVHFSGS